MLPTPRERAESSEIPISPRQRAEMKTHSIIQPVRRPSVFLRQTFDNIGQPSRPNLPYLCDIDVFRRKPEIARQHKRRTAIDRDLQLRAGVHGGATNPVEGVEQGIAIEGNRHRASLMKTPRRVRASWE